MTFYVCLNMVKRWVEIVRTGPTRGRKISELETARPVQRCAFIKKASRACGVQARRKIEEFGPGDDILRLPEHGKTMDGDQQNGTDKKSKNFRVRDRARPAAPLIHQKSIRGMWRTSQKKIEKFGPGAVVIASLE